MKHFFKIAFLSFFIVSNCVNAQIVTFINENFNSGFPATWTRVNNDGLAPSAAVSFVNNAWVSYDDIDSLGIGDSVAVATSFYSPAGTANDWMITPAITLKNNGNSIQWQVRSQDPSYPDGYDVMISTSIPVLDSFYVDSTLYSVDFEFPYWTTREVSLDAYINQTVYIAFHAKSNDQFLLLIDNVYIYADTLVSVNEKPIIENKLSVFPNPANDFVNVFSIKQIDKANLIDLSGKIISSTSPFTNKFQFSLTGINQGIYILQVIYSDGSQSQLKIIRA